MRVTEFDASFDEGPILPPDPDGLDVLHEREYRILAYRFPKTEDGGDVLLLRGAVRDQKPAHLYIAEDPDPLTIHHMQVELHVAFPSMLILESSVLFESHPHDTCGSIAETYKGRVGLSIARGFIHKARELFGAHAAAPTPPRWCWRWHPWAIQCIWSMHATEMRRTGPPVLRPEDLSPEERERRLAASLNSCHVWENDGDFVRELRAGRAVEVPIPMKRRFEQLGIDMATRGLE